MSGFSIDEGACGAGASSYESGLLTLPNGTTCGVETIARFTPRVDNGRRAGASAAFPGFLGSLREALPASGRLPMPARLAVSTVRAGLGAIEEGLSPERGEPVAVEIAFGDGTTIVARMPEGLVAVMRRDREIALAVLARAARNPGVPEESVPEAREAGEALTSIFRYEKRNGRLRRVAEPGPTAED